MKIVPRVSSYLGPQDCFAPDDSLQYGMRHLEKAIPDHSSIIQLLKDEDAPTSQTYVDGLLALRLHFSSVMIQGSSIPIVTFSPAAFILARWSS